jgi:hypothetical protein
VREIVRGEGKKREEESVNIELLGLVRSQREQREDAVACTRQRKFEGKGGKSGIVRRVCAQVTVSSRTFFVDQPIIKFEWT